MQCPYCLLRQAKLRYVELDRHHTFTFNSCDDCQKKVDKAIKNTSLVQRGLLKKYITIGGAI